MIIDFEIARKKLESKEVDKKIEQYTQNIIIALEAIEDILDDIEISEIDWFKVKGDHREKIEAISKSALFMEVYLGWAKESR